MSRWDVGSSITRMSQSFAWTTILESMTLVLSPPERVDMGRSIRSVDSPTFSRAAILLPSSSMSDLASWASRAAFSSARAFQSMSPPATLCSSISLILRQMFSMWPYGLPRTSRTVTSGESSANCSRYPILSVFLVSSPVSGFISPRRILRNVVFPAPFTPIRPMLSPSLIWRLTSLRTLCGPKALVTDWAFMSMVGTMGSL